jgi:hypothetical protein
MGLGLTVNIGRIGRTGLTDWKKLCPSIMSVTTRATSAGKRNAEVQEQRQNRIAAELQ